MNTICVFIEKIVRTAQTKKISKNLPEQKSRNPLCIKGFWDFLFDEKLRETREILSKNDQMRNPAKKEKKPQKHSVFKAFDGGEEGIRSRLRARSGSALTCHRQVIHSRPVRIPLISKERSTSMKCFSLLAAE